jgi:hypothetical protein
MNALFSSCASISFCWSKTGDVISMVFVQFFGWIERYFDFVYLAMEKELECDSYMV